MTLAFQLPDEGIYIINIPAKKSECNNELRMIISRSRVCLSRKPIVSLDIIDYVTDIQYDPRRKVYYVDIGITSSGMRTINQTVLSLPNSRFAMVVNNEVICLFAGSTEYAINSIRIGEDTQLKDLTTIHEVLRRVKN